MKTLPAPDVLIRTWLHDPHAITVAAFAISGVFFSVAAWQIQRNLRHNEPGLRLPLALPFALAISAFGLFAANRLPFPWSLFAGGIVVLISGGLFYFADHRRYVRDPQGNTVADRWAIVLSFAGFRWIRDKANRHFFFSGDTGSGKTSGMNALLADLVKRNPTLGGVVMANKGDEWFYLEWLAKKYGRQNDIIRLRPRLVGEPDRPQHRLNVTGDARLPFTTRARILVDTAAALNPRDEKGFFKVKGAAHIGRAFELLADIGRPVTATTRCGRRRLGSALTAASGDSSSEHDHSPGSLPVAGSPVATPTALPHSHLRRLLPPLAACRLRSAPTPARRPVPLDPEDDAQTPLGYPCSLSLHRSRIRSERSLSPVGCLIVAPAPAGGRRRERLRPSAPQGIARCAALHLARRC